MVRRPPQGLRREGRLSAGGITTEPLEVDGVDPLGRALIKALPSFASRRFFSRLAGEAGRFAADAGRILAGTSSIEPGSRNQQFADPAWSAHPVYRRVKQLYLRAGEFALAIPDMPEIDWTTSERLRFLISQALDAASPNNTVLGNPTALRRAAETRGRSLVQGARNLAEDVTSGRRLPARADHGAFRVGENVAATPGAVIHRGELYELIQYAPSTPEVFARPLLHVPSVVNRHYVMDLTPRRSLAKYGVDRGMSTFSMVWRNPSPELGDRGFDHYVAAALEAAT